MCARLEIRTGRLARRARAVRAKCSLAGLTITMVLFHPYYVSLWLATHLSPRALTSFASLRFADWHRQSSFHPINKAWDPKQHVLERGPVGYQPTNSLKLTFFSSKNGRHFKRLSWTKNFCLSLSSDLLCASLN